MRLHRGDVLAGALAQLDRDGFENLTMQALAKTLGVQPGALYWHYADKRALIDAMAEAIIANLDYSDDVTQSWSVRLSSFAGGIHQALLSRRDGARLVAGTFVAQQNTLRAGRVLVEIVQEAGLDIDVAARTALSVFYYILGYTIEEQSRLSLVSDDLWGQHRGEVLERSPAEIGQAVASAQQSDTFAVGIDLFIAGIEARSPGPKC